MTDEQYRLILRWLMVIAASTAILVGALVVGPTFRAVFG